MQENRDLAAVLNVIPRRKLHGSKFSFTQDIQTDTPFHLIHLKVEVEKSKLMALLQECQAELTRENRHLSSTGSERLIKEHRVSSTEREELGGVGGGWISALLASNTLCFISHRLFSRRGAPSLFVRKGCS